MNTVQKTLMQFGLTESDTKIYLMLNQAGESNVESIIDQTHFSRTTVYDVINTLAAKKLITQRKVGRTVLYNATHPQQLQVLIDEKHLADSELERNMKANIEQLTKSFDLASNQPGIYAFEGKDGITRVYDELLDDNENIDSIEDQGQMEQFMGDYAQYFVQQRIQRKIFNRVIAPSNNTLNTSSPTELREARHVDKSVFPFEMDMRINQKRVVLTTFQHSNAIGIVIVHPEIVRNFHILFNWLWNLQGIPR